MRKTTLLLLSASLVVSMLCSCSNQQSVPVADGSSSVAQSSEPAIVSPTQDKKQLVSSYELLSAGMSDMLSQQCGNFVEDYAIVELHDINNLNSDWETPYREAVIKKDGTVYSLVPNHSRPYDTPIIGGSYLAFTGNNINQLICIDGTILFEEHDEIRIVDPNTRQADGCIPISKYIGTFSDGHYQFGILNADGTMKYEPIDLPEILVGSRKNAVYNFNPSEFKQVKDDIYIIMSSPYGFLVDFSSGGIIALHDMINGPILVGDGELILTQEGRSGEVTFYQIDPATGAALSTTQREYTSAENSVLSDGLYLDNMGRSNQKSFYRTDGSLAFEIPEDEGYDVPMGTSFQDGCVALGRKNAATGKIEVSLLDSAGNTVYGPIDLGAGQLVGMTSTKDKRIYTFADDGRNGMIIDQNGTVLIDGLHNKAVFSNGLCLVQFNDAASLADKASEIPCCYIDEKGNVVMGSR